MKKKLFSVAICVAMLISLLAGCSGGNKKTEGQKDESKADGDTLVYWSMWEAVEPQGVAIQAAIDAYTEETGVKVDVQFKGRTGIREGLEPALEAGTKIDLFDEDIDRVNKTWGKYLMDLEEFVKDGYEDTAIPGLMSACREVSDGTLKSIPYQPNVFAFFYNKDLFEKAGIKEEPKTWEEFLAVCEKLKQANIVPLTCDDAYADCMIGYHLGRLGGEEKVVEIVENGTWDDPIVVQMAKDYEELAKKGYFSENVGSNVWPAGQNTELALGEVAMYLNGSWLPNEVKDMAGEDFNWGCFSYPAVAGGVTGTEAANYGAQVFAINKESKKGKEAYDLIKTITKGQYDKELAEETVGIPADTENSEWPKLISSVKPVMDSSTIRYSWAVGIETDTDMTPVIKENFIKLMAGTMTADEFVTTMKAASK